MDAQPLRRAREPLQHRGNFRIESGLICPLVREVLCCRSGGVAKKVPQFN